MIQASMTTLDVHWLPRPNANAKWRGECQKLHMTRFLCLEVPLHKTVVF